MYTKLYVPMKPSASNISVTTLSRVYALGNDKRTIVVHWSSGRSIFACAFPFGSSSSSRSALAFRFRCWFLRPDGAEGAPDGGALFPGHGQGQATHGAAGSRSMGREGEAGRSRDIVEVGHTLAAPASGLDAVVAGHGHSQDAGGVHHNPAVGSKAAKAVADSQCTVAGGKLVDRDPVVAGRDAADVGKAPVAAGGVLAAARGAPAAAGKDRVAARRGPAAAGEVPAAAGAAPAAAC
eukprot:CAMPEP_0180475494 /NCGR_PEP_ID=MMETSP1036_2-20121128/31231_1 /TAXON_ID=632150 /ORGANISM="Azadinium spinosum, Strain 3D9" /LENGTH=236 /DNA_ID=CAMNT_0022482863 /DNA_START=467 /DNA_END=1175 /DNA_ORIENTATION=+